MYCRVLAVVLTLASLLAGELSSAAADSSAWASTATQAIALANATDLGRLTSSTPIEISVALTLRNQSALQSYIKEVSSPGSPMYGQSLTPDEFRAQYGPTSDQVQAVESYLTNQGFQDVSASSNNIYVSGWATPDEADTAFNTEIDSFSQNGSTVYANVSPASVPSSLSGVAIAVLGLTDALKMQIPLHDTAVPSTGTPSTNVPNSYWAPGFQQAYDATGTATASKTSIAIMMEGDLTTVVSDLRAYEADPHNNLPQVPVSIVHVGIPSPDTSGLVEWDMDSQTSTGLAGDVQHLYMYDATSLTDEDVAAEFNAWAAQDVAKAASASFGECEYAAYLDGFMVANDEAMTEAAAQGQTMFASAGDSGGFCAINGAANGVPMVGEPDVNYPASSPYVVAAGGTSLITNTDGSYGEELAWDAGGGGVSYFEYQPFWQSGVAPPTGSTCQVQSPVCLGKALPDVAMDADFLLSAANFYNNGATTSNGGTSLASPLSLGSWARIESNRDNAIGFASPSLYAASGTAGFHDVTLGDNGPYPALPGWDFATGNGSFDIAKMIGVVTSWPPSSLPPVPSPSCNLAFGTGSANPIGSTGNNDAMSIYSVGLSSDRSAKTITGAIRVKSLNDGPGGLPELSGSGDQWYLEFSWQPGNASTAATYFLSAAYDPSTAAQSQDPTGFAFGYGHLSQLATGGANFNPDGSATGSVDFANGVIYITAPWSDFGGQLSPAVPTPTLNSQLTHVGAATYEEIGTNETGGLLESAGSASGSTPYLVGHNCEPATLTLDSGSLNQTYSGGPAAVTATSNPPGLSYSVTYNGSSTPPATAGSYDVEASISDLDHVGTTSGTLTVAKAALTITAGSPSATYGHPLPAIAPTYSGFVSGDTATALTSQPSCASAATASSAAGAYATNCSGASSPNYAFTYAPGTLTIVKAPLTVTAGTAKMTFGQAIPTITPTYSGWVNGDGAAALASAPICSAAVTAASGAGTYATRCSGGSSANYDLGYKAGTLTVELAPTRLTYTGHASLKRGSKATLSARLTSTVTDGAVAGRELSFSLGSQRCAGLTRASGIATCAIDKVRAKTGSAKVAIVFAGDGTGSSYDYSATSTSRSVKVK